MWARSFKRVRSYKLVTAGLLGDPCISLTRHSGLRISPFRGWRLDIGGPYTGVLFLGQGGDLFTFGTCASQQPIDPRRSRETRATSS